MAAASSALEELRARASNPGSTDSFFSTSIANAPIEIAPYGAITDEQAEAINELIKSLAEGVISITRDYFNNKLQNYGKIIATLHPLTYWHFILDPKHADRIEKIRIIFDQQRAIKGLLNPFYWLYGLIQREMIAGFEQVFTDRLEKDDLLDHLPPFVKERNLEKQFEQLRAFAEKRQLKEFTELLFK